jgi:type II secretory pathway component GspD/PulD (secretin)
VIPLEYCTADDAVAAISSSFPDLQVSKVPGQNMIMVKGYRDDVLGAKSLAAGLDRPPPANPQTP